MLRTYSAVSIVLWGFRLGFLSSNKQAGMLDAARYMKNMNMSCSFVKYLLHALHTLEPRNWNLRFSTVFALHHVLPNTPCNMDSSCAWYPVASRLVL